MSTLPEGWSKASIGDLIASDGLFSDGDWVESKDQDPKGSNRLLQLADIGDGVFLNKSRRFVNDEKFDALNCTELQANDVLVARMPDPLGRACLMPELPQRCLTVVDVAILRPGANSVKPDWLMHSINSPLVRDEIELLSSGTTRRRISRRNLALIGLPVPPLNEQKRIADKLNALLMRVETCREQLERVPLILKRFREGVLAIAMLGKLTEDWREEHGHQLDWKKVRLSDVGMIGRGKSKHRPRNDPRLYGGPYPFIQTGDIAQSGGLITNHSQTYNEFGLSQSKLWPAGTVCITIAANIADTAILTYPACFPDSVVGFVADPQKSLPQFVKWFIEIIRTDLESFAPATAQKNINLAVLNDVEFKCPSLDEQYEVVRRVETLLAFADRLESHYKAARARVEQLTPALLTKAFRGELVPQDPKDEPASVLLKRIRASRATAEGAEEITRAKRRTNLVKKPKAQIIMLKRKDVEPSHLSAILKANGPLSAEALWSASQLDIDEFYDQLKDEEARELLRETVGEQRLLEAA